MKTIIIIGILILPFVAGITGSDGYAQVGINTDQSAPDPSAALDLKFSDKGFLPPRLTTVQRNGISAPANGLLIYNADCNDLQFYNGAGWIPMGNNGLEYCPDQLTGIPNPCHHAKGVIYSIDSVEGATGYHWTVPPGAKITSGQGTTSIAVDFGNAGGHLCVAAYDDCNRSRMKCMVISPDPGMTVQVSISAAPHPYCDDPEYIFMSNPENGGTSPSYQWKLNGLGIPGATNSTFSTNALGCIGCTITSSETCIHGSDTASASLMATVCETVAYGQPIILLCNFDCGCNNPEATFRWTNSSGSWSSSERDPIILPGEPGYSTDHFYITILFSPPPGGINHGVCYREIVPF